MYMAGSVPGAHLTVDGGLAKSETGRQVCVALPLHRGAVRAHVDALHRICQRRGKEQGNNSAHTQKRGSGRSTRASGLLPMGLMLCPSHAMFPSAAQQVSGTVFQAQNCILICTVPDIIHILAGYLYLPGYVCGSRSHFDRNSTWLVVAPRKALELWHARVTPSCREATFLKRQDLDLPQFHHVKYRDGGEGDVTDRGKGRLEGLESMS